ncbi:MAG: porin [Comamonas sp.]
MKIQRLMLAVLAVCGTSAALAQSSVTIYGRVNTSIEQQKLGDNKVTGMFNNASRIGFKGVEDLGGGLKAGFQLEAGFGSDDGSGPLTFGRQSEVNLSGNWGMVRLGNFTAESYYATADYISMHNHDTGSSSDALYVYGMRDTNKISYRTPEMGGFWAEAAYSFHEKASIKGQDGVTNIGTQKNAVDLAANYNNGPLGLGAGFTQISGSDLVGGNDKLQQLGLRASYAIGALTLGGYYQYAKESYKAPGVSDSAKRHAVRLAAMYTLGASEFHANVGRANKWKPDGDGTGATQWTLGYNYNLSKRTKVYTYYTRVNNGNNADYGYGFNSNLKALQAGAEGKDFSSFAVGVRHNF